MIRIQALGGLRIFVRDQESVALAKQRLKCGLLVYLGVERSVMRESLIATFWPDKEPDKARHALSQNLYELRKILGEDWLLVAGDRLTVPDNVHCDAVDFTDAAEAGQLDRALDLYGGKFLEGCYLAETRDFEEWIDRRQDRMVKLLRRTLRDASQLPEAPPWIETAIEAAHRVADHDPTDDDVQHAYLQLLVRAGRRSEALRQYERYEAALADDKLEPLEHTKQLIAAARESAESAQPQRVFPLGEPQRSGTPIEPELTSAELPNALTGDPVVAATPQRKLSRRGGVVAGLVVVGIGGTAAWFIGSAAPGPAEVAGAADPRIAVLYFADKSLSGDLKNLPSAFTEELIEAFTVRGLQVVSKQASQSERDSTITYSDWVEKYKPDYLIDGNVEFVNDSLRVKPTLTDVATNTNVPVKEIRRPWSKSMDRADLVQQVAVELRMTIGKEVELRRRRSETRSQEAWKLYQMASRSYEDFVPLMMSQGVDAAEKTLKRADTLLATAQKRDGSWNAPTVLRGRLASQRVQVAVARGGTQEKVSAGIRAALDLAIAHADVALQENADDAEALELRGVMTYRIWWSRTVRPNEVDSILDNAEHFLQRAVELDATRVEAHAMLSSLYLKQARFAEAMQAATNAYTHDRYHSGAQESLFQLALSSFEVVGAESEASRWCNEGARRYPRSHQFVHCALMLVAWGKEPNPDSALALLGRVPQLHAAPRTQDPSAVFMLMAASALARAGKRDEALAMIDNAPRNMHDNSVLWLEAAARAYLGQPDSAMALLDRFVKVEPQGRVQVVASRALRESLGSDSRFATLSDQLGIKRP